MPGIVNANERIAAALEALVEILNSDIPKPTADDNGKVLAVENGAYALVYLEDIPEHEDPDAE